MAITVSGVTSTALTHKLIMEDGADQNSVISFNGNVTGGSGRLYSIYVSNGVAAGMFLKVYFDAAAASSDDPDMKIEWAASAAEEIIMPNGIPFTELSFFSTKSGDTSSSQTAPGGGVTVNLVTS